MRQILAEASERARQSARETGEPVGPTTAEQEVSKGIDAGARVAELAATGGAHCPAALQISLKKRRAITLWSI